MRRFIRVIGLWVLVLLGSTALAQDKTKVIDKIVGFVGSDIVLHSSIENQVAQMRASGVNVTDQQRCDLLEEALYQKLLVDQAKLDSLEIPQGQVEMELDRRLRYFIGQLGSEEKLEQFYNKSISEIKEEFYDQIKDQLLAQQMQQKLTDAVQVTPAEVRAYYESIPKDSIPYINAEVTIAHIAAIPEVSQAQKDATRERLEGMRKRILDGEDFSVLAILYSEDPGSASNGGELGFTNRADLVPEFSSVGFDLEPGEVSEVVETQYGFHVIQMIERRGDEANMRHILLTVQLSPMDLEASRKQLDSLVKVLNDPNDTLTFERAANMFSDDKDSKNSGGIMRNPETGEASFEPQTLKYYDMNLPFTVQGMEIGEVAGPMPYQSMDGKRYFHIIKLVSRTVPHVANLTDDYQRIKEAALLDKKYKSMNDWIQTKIESTYIRLDSSYLNCQFQNDWSGVAQ